MFYIYIHTKPKESAPFYIGKGKDNRAKSKGNRNKYWHNIVNKYGYEISIIESNLTESQAFELEKLYISAWKELGHCEANLTLGGEGVSGLRGLKAWNKGIPWSDEIRFKLRKAKLGKVSPKRKQIIDLSTGFVWDSCHEAAEVYGYNQGTLSRYLSGKRPNLTQLRYV